MSVTIHLKDSDSPVVISSAVTAQPYEFTNTERVDDQFIAVWSTSSLIALVPVVNVEYVEIA